MHLRDRHHRPAAAAVLAGCLLAAVLAGCGQTHGGGAIATFTPSVTIAAPASSAAAHDVNVLAKACSPPGPDGKPAADPVAALLTPGAPGKAARAYTRHCMEVPAHDWPALGSCFITWGAKMHAALAKAGAVFRPGYQQLWGVEILNWCRAYARGNTKGVPQPVLR